MAARSGRTCALGIAARSGGDTRARNGLAPRRDTRSNGTRAPARARALAGDSRTSPGLGAAPSGHEEAQEGTEGGGGGGSHGIGPRFGTRVETKAKGDRAKLPGPGGRVCTQQQWEGQGRRSVSTIKTL